MFIAAYRGYVDIVKFLIEKGADLERPNSRATRPFIFASRRLDIAELLTDRGVALSRERGRPAPFGVPEGN